MQYHKVVENELKLKSKIKELEEKIAKLEKEYKEEEEKARAELTNTQFISKLSYYSSHDIKEYKRLCNKGSYFGRDHK